MDTPPASTPPPLIPQQLHQFPHAPKKGLSGCAIAAIVGVILLVGLVVLAALAVPAFNKIQAQAEKLRTDTRAKELQVELTASEKVQAGAFAQELIQAVEKKDHEKVNAVVDYDFMAEEIFHGFTGSTQMKRGFMESVKKNPGGIFYEVFGQPGRVVRHWKRNGIPAITLRFVLSEGGASYFDIVLLRQKAGGFKVCDIYSYLFGVLMSKEARQTTAFVTGADAGMVAQILGSAARKKDMEALSKMVRASREGRPEEVISIYQALSPEMKNQPTAFLLYVKGLQHMGEERQDEYATALEKARGILGNDVTIDLLLVDRHVLREDYAAARKAVEVSLQTIGDDSYLQYLLGMMCVRTNDIPAAKEALKKAEAAEPDLFELVDLRMQTRAAEKDFAGVIQAVEAFKARTGATITPDMMTEPVYGDFKKSPEFTRWSATVKKTAP
ncbi:MAG: hypothetical protein V4662_02525 [Verrucomicrobiota bacterium]